MQSRAEQLGQRIERGAEDLIEVARQLSDGQWRLPVDGEHRSIGVLVHHVGAMYPPEIDAVSMLVAKGGMPDLDWAVVNRLNADHAISIADDVDRVAAIRLVRENSREAATYVRNLTNDQLDLVAPTGLHWNAPLTVQYFIEYHPVAHPYTHLQSIRKVLAGQSSNCR